MDNQITVTEDKIIVLLNGETFEVRPFQSHYPDRQPHGEYFLYEKLHVWELHQDAIDLDGKISPGYFSQQLIPEADKGHDFCLYCGADNGLHGSARQGWDCYWCGGN